MGSIKLVTLWAQSLCLSAWSFLGSLLQNDDLVLSRNRRCWERNKKFFDSNNLFLHVVNSDLYQFQVKLYTLAISLVMQIYGGLEFYMKWYSVSLAAFIDLFVFFFFLISNICIDKKGNPSTLEVNKGKEITNKNYKSLGNQ